MRFPLILAATLLSVPSFAQVAPPPGQNPSGGEQKPPTIEQQANADAAGMTAAQTKISATMESWRLGLISLGAQRDNFQAQVLVVSKERDDAKAALTKLQAELVAAKAHPSATAPK